MWQVNDKAVRLTPPKDVWVQSVDGTSRGYDITGLAINGNTYNPSAKDEVFVTIFVETATVYVAFDNAARTINDATTIAAGGTPAYANAHCYPIPAGTSARFCISRTLHTTLMLKCAGAGTATARIYFSSENDYINRGF